MPTWSIHIILLFQESTEFAQIYNGYRQSLKTQNGKSGGLFTSTTSLKDLPDSMDWRAKGYVTEVKNQVSFEKLVRSGSIMSQWETDSLILWSLININFHGENYRTGSGRQAKMTLSSCPLSQFSLSCAHAQGWFCLSLSLSSALNYQISTCRHLSNL